MNVYKKKKKTIFKPCLKGLRRDLSSIFSKFVFSFLMSRMAKMSVFNALSKFKS